MKTPFIAVLVVCFTSISYTQANFEDQWKTVEQYEREGLIKSAASLVEEIYAAAKQDKRNQHLLKALLHKSKYMLTLEEDAQLNIINQLS
jgi:hypothetical protein